MCTDNIVYVKEVSRKKSWYSTVYKPSIHGELDPDVRNRISKRDKYRCQVMDCKDRAGLTVHHIMPRDAGGCDNDENLILLCGRHHDLIELSGIREYNLIINYTENDTVPDKKTRVAESGDWRTWVYGGAKNPRK